VALDNNLWILFQQKGKNYCDWPYCIEIWLGVLTVVLSGSCKAMVLRVDSTAFGLTRILCTTDKNGKKGVFDLTVVRDGKTGTG